MTYQVLARKWRPQDFASLVGQESIVTALRNALTEERIAQAYLFSGIRGVGKTTAARVFAKAINCPTRAQAGGTDPCNDCRSCRQITAGNDLDVIEVDAATYSKVEQIRELTESLRYGPANGRYKVVVLDEVHRLSRQAFDALLKIVEEPPAHLVFLFATTELEAVPATILSRCQQFQFRRVASKVLADYLRVLSERESITVSDAALRRIARAGEGSVRDAVALLDQLATFGSGTIRDDDASRLLGGLDTAVFYRLLDAVLSGDAGAIVALVGEIEQNGWDPTNVYSQFLAYSRDGLHLAVGGDLDSVDLPREEAERLAERAREAGYENLLRLLQLLLDGEETVRRAELGALALEIGWLRAAELPKLTQVEALLRGAPVAAPATGAAAAAPRPATRAAPRPAPTARQAPAVPPAAAPPSTAGPASPPAAAPSDGGGDPMARFLAAVGSRRGRLASLLGRAHRRFADGRLTIDVAADDTPLDSALRRAANAEAMDQAVREVWGAEARWRTRPVTSAPAPAAAASSPAAAAAEQHDDPTVQAVLEIFDGTIESVRDERTAPDEDRTR